MAGVDVRVEGGHRICRSSLRFYASDQVHSAHQKSVETLGLGSKALRLVPTDDAITGWMSQHWHRDGCRGPRGGASFRPASSQRPEPPTPVSIDDLVLRLPRFASREGLWFHIDGCIGAFLIRLAPKHKRAGRRGWTWPIAWRLTRINGCRPRSNAAAVAGARRTSVHFETFTLHGDYLQQSRARGILAGVEFHRGLRVRA